MTDWKNHKELQEAVSGYLDAHDVQLPDDAEFASGIDSVWVYAFGEPVLIVGLPPVSQYPVRATEHTHLLYRQAPVGVSA
jgi:hypothetical protein